MYIPHTEADREAMLRTIGISELEDLFRTSRPSYRFPEAEPSTCVD